MKPDTLHKAAESATKASRDRERRRLEWTRGQVLPLLAFGIIAVLGMISLAIDVGYWRYQQRLEQSAADAAATAGAIRLYYATTSAAPAAPPEVVLAANAAAKDNSFDYNDPSGDVTVTVNSPPTNNTPPIAGATPYPANSAVEVIISKKQPRFFGSVFGSTRPSVSARAVAVKTADINACFYQLGLQSTSGGEIGITGNKVARVINCGVDANGNVSVPGFDPSTTGLNWYGSSPPSTGSFNSAKVHQAPSPFLDPCFKITGCAYLQSQTLPPSSLAVDVSLSSSITAPAAPGYAVIKNCCKSGTALGPGLYYVYGGVSGALTGDAVTIVGVDGVMGASGLGSGHPYYTAPTSGPTAGIAYYQPPSNTNDITLNGGGNGASQWDGVFYAPSAHITANGGGVTFSFLVIKGILEHGGGNSQGIVVDPTLGGTATLNPQQFATHVVLSE